MTGMAITPQELRGDAAWVCTFADEITDIRWPAVGLAGSETVAAIPEFVPGLGDLAAGLREWAVGARDAAAALGTADGRAAAGLPPR
jgi:hypothetical protein